MAAGGCGIVATIKTQPATNTTGDEYVSALVATILLDTTTRECGWFPQRASAKRS